jgi:hypothetical protein
MAPKKASDGSIARPAQARAALMRILTGLS